jgi:hypothetical protein
MFETVWIGFIVFIFWMLFFIIAMVFALHHPRTINQGKTNERQKILRKVEE